MEKPRVLIVDDNARFARNAQLFLKQTGNYVVCPVNDPLRTLETARSFKPDLVILDLITPRTDNLELTAQLEADWGAARSADRFHDDSDHARRNARWSPDQWPSRRSEAQTWFRPYQSWGENLPSCSSA